MMAHLEIGFPDELVDTLENSIGIFGVLKNPRFLTFMRPYIGNPTLLGG